MNLADFFAKEFEKYNRYWEIVKGGGIEFEKKLTAPPVSPDPLKIPQSPTITGLPGKTVAEISQKDWMLYKAFHEHLIATMLVTVNQMERWKRWQVKSPDWVEPPFNAKPIDTYNPGWVNVEKNLPTTEVLVLNIVVPVGHIAIINRIGNIADPIGAYTDLYWTIRVDEKVLPSVIEWYYADTTVPTPVKTRGEQYLNFQIQLGEVTNPTQLPMPIILKEKQTLCLLVKNSSLISSYKVRARIMGYIFAPIGGMFAPEFAMQEYGKGM